MRDHFRLLPDINNIANIQPRLYKAISDIELLP